MSIRTTARAVAATLIIGVSAAAPISASAGTPACGPGCIGVFSSELGTYAQPNFVEHVFGGIARVGTPTGLNAVSGSETIRGRSVSWVVSNPTAKSRQVEMVVQRRGLANTSTVFSDTLRLFLSK